MLIRQELRYLTSFNLIDMITEVVGKNSTSIKIPRIVVAGIQSGCGKTTVSRGLMAALKKRGLNVQPFKIGPDFIDPSHHTAICGRISRNLDLVMTGKEGVLDSFKNGCLGADIAVIEGVMGMYDGLDGTTFGSSAHIARILNAPVILVIPAEGMATSVHAIINGFRQYEPDTNLAGVILNRVNSHRHRSLLKEKAELPQLGYLPYQSLLFTESRHLGLIMGDEKTQDDPAFLIEENCNIPAIIDIAKSAPPLEITNSSQIIPKYSVRIGVARDSAFCFYYQHNLEILSQCGAHLEFFSPIQDPLPDIDALYIGGGYPELHAEDLEKGISRLQIKKECENGLTVWGECGGLLYLSEALEGERNHKWVGILPAYAEMCNRFQALGYCEGVTSGGTKITQKSCQIKGHEFHYSTIHPGSDARYSVSLHRGKGIEGGKEGLYSYETVGCYTHSWFSEKFCREFIHCASKYKKC